LISSPRTLPQRTFRVSPYLLFTILLTTVAPLFTGRSAIASAPESQAPAQNSALPVGQPRAWAQAAATNELHIIDDDGNAPLRYRIRKIDTRSDTTRLIIETRQGDVARLIERNGQPLTAAEDAAERERLNAILQSPADFIKHHKRDNSTRTDVMQLVSLMPQAMIYTFVPGQPQSQSATSTQVVIDFRPDPAFHPPSMLADLLTGLEGRMWIDAGSQHVTRIEGQVIKMVNFGFGIVARIAPGGTIEFEQTNAGGNRWVYSHLVEKFSVRAMMVKTIPENTRMSASDFHLLPAPVTFQEAVHLLLATPIPLR